MKRAILFFIFSFSIKLGVCQIKNDLDSSTIKFQNEITQLKVEIENLKIRMLAYESQGDSLKLLKNAEAPVHVTVKTEKDSILKLLYDYYACESWEDRLKFVWKPESVKKKMKAYYDFKGYQSQDVKWKPFMVIGKNFKNGDIIKVSDYGITVYLRKIENAFVLDWEATVGFNPTPLKVFSGNKSKTPTVFRAQCSLGDYYNFDFRNSVDTHLNLLCQIEDQRYNTVYVPKQSLAGRKIYQILNDGNKHDLIIEIKYSEDNFSLIVTNFIQEGWSIH